MNALLYTSLAFASSCSPLTFLWNPSKHFSHARARTQPVWNRHRRRVTRGYAVAGAGQETSCSETEQRRNESRLPPDRFMHLSLRHPVVGTRTELALRLVVGRPGGSTRDGPNHHAGRHRGT